MSRFLVLALLIVTLFGGAESTHAAPELDSRLAGFPTLTFRLSETGIEAPATAPAGPTVLIEEESGDHSGHAFMFRVPDDVSESALGAVLASAASVVEETPEWFYQASFVGNGDRALSDRPAMALVVLEPGRYLIGDPFRPTNQWARIAVTAANPATPAPAITADAKVDLFEMDFAIPADLAGGTRIWEVKNAGAMLHEMALFPVPAGATKDDTLAAVLAVGDAAFGAELTPEMAAAAAAIGPAWDGWTLELAGGVGVLAPQTTSWAQLELPAGTYAAICFIPGPDGTPHFMTGMLQVFTVHPAA